MGIQQMKYNSGSSSCFSKKQSLHVINLILALDMAAGGTSFAPGRRGRSGIATGPDVPVWGAVGGTADRGDIEPIWSGYKGSVIFYFNLTRPKLTKHILNSLALTKLTNITKI